MESVNNENQTLSEFIEDYKENKLSKYQRPSVTVDNLVFTVAEGSVDNYRKLADDELQILLIKRNNHPFIGQWALPGGFVNIDEDLMTAAKRELREETNMDNIYMEQLYTWGGMDRDDPRTRVISVSYIALTDKIGFSLKADTDAEDVKWFTVSAALENKNIDNINNIITEYHRISLKSDSDTASALVCVRRTITGRTAHTELTVTEKDNIAFDHARMIYYALERLKNKVEYTDIVFNMMPECFTLTRLKTVYEILLGRELYQAQFRREIEKKLIKTDMMSDGKGHRPAALYRFNPFWNFNDI